ncbi:MAG: restriction endonuclease subunit S [Planctomycetes bacterium]|nr:restriction endonuclease subunit S [Planctomycetota bacterium]
MTNLWLNPADVPSFPTDWRVMPTEEASIQLPVGLRYDARTVSPVGAIPVVDQSQGGFLGFHNDPPGVVVTQDHPVVTFANHTCALRLFREPFSCIQNVFPKIGRDGICDTTFFYYASQGRVTLTDYKGHHPLFRRALIPIPPLSIQRRIAAILSAYDDLIDNHRRRIRLLEEMARRLYREWFVHFRYPGHESVPLVCGEQGESPNGWQWQSLDDLAQVNANQLSERGLPPNIYYIDIASVSPGQIDTISEIPANDAPGRARRVVADGDILWSCVRPNRRSYAVVLQPDKHTIASTGFAVLSAKTVPWTYLYASVTTEAFVGYLSGRAQGAAYPAVKAADFQNATILHPDDAVLSRFHEETEPLHRLAENIRRQITNLRRTRDLLLPRLMSGRLSVAAAEAAVP